MALVWNGTPASGTQYQNAAGALTVTFTGMGTGTASSDRITVLDFDYAIGAGTFGFTSVVIHSPNIASDPTGTNATLISQIGDTNINLSVAEIWYVANPNNTTADVVATIATNGTQGCALSVGALTGANSTPGTPQTFQTASAVSATLSTPSVTIPAGGICLMALAGTGLATGFTGATIDTTTSGTNAGLKTAFATSAGSFTPTATGCTTSSPYAFIAVPWGPAAPTAAQEGTPKGTIFTPGSGPTRQLRGAKAFPPTNVPVALLARATSISKGLAGFSGSVSLLGRTSVANHTIVNIGTALGALAAQVGMPQGFLFRPGAGPTWDVKRRAAFPADITGGPVSLFARSFVAGFARANASGAVPLAAKSEAMAKATDGIAGAVPLAAKSEAMAKTVDRITGTLPLSGASAVSGHARATFSGAVPLSAKTAIISTAKATLGLAANLIALAGLIGAAVKARAGLTGSVSLLARSSLTTKASAGLSGSVVLSAKSAITSSARATMTAAVALTAVAGRIGIAVKSRGAMTVNLALSATTAIKTATTAAIVAFGVHTVGRPLKNAQTRVRTIYNTLRRNS